MDKPRAKTRDAVSVGSSGRPISILLVEDHEVVRLALKLYLNSYDDLRVVGDVGGGRAAVTAVASLRPDVVLMDLVLPGQGGLDATNEIRRSHSRTRVLIFSGFVDEETLLAAVRAGAAGYLLKSVEGPELANAIRAVHRGGTHFSGSLPLGLDPSTLATRAADPNTRVGLDALTQRERQVLRLIGDGLSNSAIANELLISPNTVESHRWHVMKKLHARSRSELIRIAIRGGLVAPESPPMGPAEGNDSAAEA